MIFPEPVGLTRQHCIEVQDTLDLESVIYFFYLILNITTQSIDYLDALLKLTTQKRTNPLTLLSFRQPQQITTKLGRLF